MSLTDENEISMEAKKLIDEMVDNHFKMMRSKKFMEDIESALLGRKISKIRYMAEDEAENFGWYKSPIIIELDNGTQLIPSKDDEGNDGGALWTNLEGLEVIPAEVRGI